MTAYTTGRNWLSIAAGVIAGGAATSLLIRDGFATGFTLDHALMPALVALTVVFGHLAISAMKDTRLLAALAFAGLAAFGSAMTVYETTGRRAEVRDAKVMTAGASQAERSHLMKMRAEAEETLKKHRDDLPTACKVDYSDRCNAKKYTIKTWEAAVKGYAAELQAMPVVPVDAKAERVAAVAAMFGLPAEMVKARVQTFEPMLFPLFLELGAIVAFSFGFGGRREMVKETVATKAQQPLQALDYTNTDAITDADLEELKKILRGKVVNNKELASLLGVSTGEASKRVSDAVAAGLVQRERVGKNAMISLAVN